MAEGAFESRVSAKRETKSGIFITLEVQPNDYSEDLSMLRVGSAVQIGWAEIVDTSVRRMAIVDSLSHKADQKDRTDQARELVDKVRKPFDSLPLVQQCGIRCSDPKFDMFLMDEYPAKAARHTETANLVRDLLGVESRSELKTDAFAQVSWTEIEKKYQRWLVTKRYEDSAR